ncbi:hypothetical protein A2W24_06630 [Microgenomates group bacterium RBG_16_45_19]|nr:MAG: hypothetical protein A2W24_06630 [Microgenomates group bacterium RBG_16_45_19]
MGQKKSTWTTWILAIGVGLGLTIHLYAAIHQPFFGDEILSVFFANSYSLAQLLAHRLEPIHPNLYYLLVKILFGLGISDLGLRLAHFGLFGLSTWLVYRFFGFWSLNHHDRLLALIFWTWSAYLLRFSYLVRMYGLAIVCLLFSLNLTFRAVASHRSLPLLVSIFIDVLGTSLVSGYWLFIAIKYSALFFLWLKHQLPPKLIKPALIGAALSLSLLSLSRSLTPQSAANLYLYWVPIPKAGDLMGMTTVLLGLANPAYYEAITAQAPAYLISLLALILIAVAAWLIIVKTPPLKANPLTSLLLWFCLSALLVELSLFLTSLIFKLPYFHVRQLFPVAVCLTLGLIYLLLRLHPARPLVGRLILLCLFGLMARKTLSYVQPDFTAYPPHFQPVPQGLVYLTPSDIELAYDTCHARSYPEIDQQCPPLNLHPLSQPVNLDQLPLATPIYLTQSAYHLFPTPTHLTCDAIAVDFYRCLKP